MVTIKSLIPTLLASAAGLTLWSAPLAATPLSATLLTTDGRPIAIYIISATPENITYSLDPSGAGPRTMLRTLISDLTISPPEDWAQVQAQFDAGNHAEVVEPLAQIAQSYSSIRAVQDSIGSVAKLYHLIALKSVGDFATLGRELEALAGAPLKLNERYQGELEFLLGWALYGRERWEQLERFLATYEDGTAPAEVALRPFRQVGLAKVAELSFLRARLREHEGQTEAALNDYYAAMTVNLGGQAWLTRESILSALRLTDQMMQEQEGQNNVARFEAHALALLADRTLEEGALPAAMRKYLERPDGLPKLPGQPESEEAPDAEQPNAEAAEGEAPEPAPAEGAAAEVGN